MKASELESRVNRHQDGEDEGMEKTSCPRVLLPFLSLSTRAMWAAENHSGLTLSLSLNGLMTVDKFQK